MNVKTANKDSYYRDKKIVGKRVLKRPKSKRHPNNNLLPDDKYENRIARNK